MSSYLERKTAEPSRQAMAFVLGEKLAVSRQRDRLASGSRVRIMDDDPVAGTCRRQQTSLACGGRKRPCSDAGRLPGQG